MSSISILVLGMHRSGTSTVTGILENLGVPVPGELLPAAADNKKGFFENRAIYQFHERILNYLGSSWDDPMPLSGQFLETPYGAGLVDELARVIEDEFLQVSPIFAVKDPRMCRFIPLWQAALDRLGVSGRAIISLRHPVDVAASLNSRNGFPRAKSFLLWLDYTLLAEHETRGMVRSFVVYDALLDDWRGVVDRFKGELCFDWPKERGRVEHKVDAFVTRDMRHHFQPTAIGNSTRLDELVTRSWDALQVLAWDAGNLEARAALDEVRRELDSSAAVISPYIAWEVEKLRNQEVEISLLTAAEKELRRVEDVLRIELAGAHESFKTSYTDLERSLKEEMKRQKDAQTEVLYRYEDKIRELQQASTESKWLREKVDELELDATRLRQQSALDRARLQTILTSTSWRALMPAHRVMNSLPAPIKARLRQIAKVGWWTVTPWKTKQRLQFLQTRANQPLLVQNDRCHPEEGDLSGYGHDFPQEKRTYSAWIKRYDTLRDHDRAAIRNRVESLSYRPLLSIVIPVYNTPEDIFSEAIASVQSQLYENWELCIADDASPSAHVVRMLEELSAAEPRVKWKRRKTNGHIAAASNTALELVAGEFVVLMDHDDLLSEHALYEVVRLLNERPDADIIYSDEDKVDETGRRFDPYFKPDFSYDLLLGQNLISHLGVYRTSLLERIGGFRSGVDGSQDYDLALRGVAASSLDKVLHIPKILYHWRQPSQGVSFSQSALDKCVAASRKAIQDHLDTIYEGQSAKAYVEACPAAPVWNQVRWPLPDQAPLVSIIIPTRDYAKLLKQCVDGLLNRTDYKNIEILIVDNGSVEQRTRDLFESWWSEPRIRIISQPGPFNYSRLNNLAVQEARGDLLLLLNNDIDVIKGNWLHEMVSLGLRPGIGAVGAKLLYADKRVQHAGMRLGAGTFYDGPGVAGHFGHLVSAGDIGYRGRYALTQDVSGVTAACLLTTRTVFEQVGKLDEDNLAVAFNDVDLCIRIREAGYRILWTPNAELFHLESASRGTDQAPEKKARFEREVRYMRSRWGRILDRDPFYNPNFDNAENPDYVLAFPRPES